MLDKDLIYEFKNKLSNIKGQLEGIVRMLDDDRDPEEILRMFKAAQKQFEQAEYELIEETFRKSLASKIAEALDACPGNCGEQEKIQLLKTQFPLLTENELTQKMKEAETTLHNIHKRK